MTDRVFTVIDGLRGIAAYLDEHGIPTAHDRGRWSAVQVARVRERSA